jgi:WD40 repeat protein
MAGNEDLPFRPDPGGTRPVDARSATGVQVGDGNTQIVYTYNQLTWTDGVTPPPLVSASGAIDSPYRGLGAFEERDAAFYFGREAEASHVLEQMRRLLDRPGLLMVSGVSGAGKSSLLRAGVLARLRGAGLASVPEAARWPCVVFTPTRAPLDELAVRVAALAGADAAAVRRGLDISPAGFALTARQAAFARPGGPAGDPPGPLSRRERRQPRLLIVVDQFEQLFSQCPDEEERQAFLTALYAAAHSGHDQQQEPGALVVLGVRADFEARCADYRLLADTVQGRYLLTAMTERQLRMAITEPARIAGSRVDDALVETLLREAIGRAPGSASGGSGRAERPGAGVLPLLSYALDQAWRNRTGKTLTLADYERTGGIEGAVAASAERAYERLTAAQQTAARQVFTLLVATTADSVSTADRAARSELTEGKDEAGARDVAAVLEVFAGERLLTLAADTVEISHEVLLDAWPLLRDSWLADAQADRIVRTRMHSAASDWIRGSREPSYLYTGAVLSEAAETVARINLAPTRHPPLSKTDQEFFRASQHAERSRARRRQALVALLLALITGLASLVFVVRREDQAAVSQRNEAVSAQLISESEATGDTNGTLSRLESVAAWRIDPTSAAGYAMLEAASLPATVTLTVSRQEITTVAFGRGPVLASLSQAGVVQLWDTATRRELGKPLGGVVDAIAFSPDGRTLAAATDAGFVQFWDAASVKQTGKPVNASAVIIAHTEQVDAMAFSPDGKILATASGDGTVRLWDVATRRQIRSRIVTGTQPAASVAFSPDGKVLATVSDEDQIALWDVATGQQIAILLPSSTSSLSPAADFVAFSPNGRTLASITGAGIVRLWDVATDRQIGAPFNDSADAVNSVAFARGGTVLITAGNDGTVRLWDVATHEQLGSPLSSGGGSVYSAAISRDGTTLASANFDGTIRVWDMTRLLQTATLTGAGIGQSQGVSVAFTPDGKIITAVTANGAILWRAANRRQIGSPLLAGIGQVEVAALSPAGTMLAMASSLPAGPSNEITLWDTATRRRLGDIRLGGLPFEIESLAFSPDGQTLAVGGNFSAVQLWNVTTRTRTGSLAGVGIGSGCPITSLAFSPDGKTLTAGSPSGTVVWDVAARKQIQGPFGAEDNVYSSATFSLAGRLLAVSNGLTLQLWHIPSRQQIGAPFSSNKNPDDLVYAVAISPDSQVLAIGNADGTVQLWDIATDQEIGSPLITSDSSSGAVMSIAFSPDGQTLAATTSDGAVQLWNVTYLVNVTRQLCTTARRSLTRAEWAEYVKGLAYEPICP